MNKPRYRIWDKKYNRWNTGRPSMDKLFILIDRTTLEFNSDRYILQISTDYRDKNGVEVFEGDIIRYDLIDNVFGKSAKKGLTKAVTVDLVSNFEEECSGGPDGSMICENIEVIGNILKNPTMLSEIINYS